MSDAGISILLVDDDPDLIELNQLLLEGNGYRVLTAYSGAEGLAVARRECPDLIIMDVMMGSETEGIDTSLAIRQDVALKATPILLLTGIRSQRGLSVDLKPHADTLPVQGVLEKPVQPRVLLSRVAELTGKASAADA